MPVYKRKRSVSRSRPYKKRAFARRTMMRKARRIGRLSTNMHKYVRYGISETFTNLSGGSWQTAIEQCTVINFDQLAGSAELKDLYDRYKITYVQIKFHLVSNPDATLSIQDNGQDPQTTPVYNSANWYPKLWYVVDYDDGNSITYSAIKQYAKAKMFVIKPDKQYKVGFKPAIRSLVYKTDTTTGTTAKFGQWIDTADPTVPHYGLKWVLDMEGLTSNIKAPYKIVVERRVWFLAKDVN